MYDNGFLQTSISFATIDYLTLKQKTFFYYFKVIYKIMKSFLEEVESASP